MVSVWASELTLPLALCEDIPEFFTSSLLLLRGSTRWPRAEPRWSCARDMKEIYSGFG